MGSKYGFLAIKKEKKICTNKISLLNHISLALFMLHYVCFDVDGFNLLS